MLSLVFNLCISSDYVKLSTWLALSYTKAVTAVYLLSSVWLVIGLNFKAEDLGNELLPNNVRELEPCDLHVPVKIKFLLDLVTIFSSGCKQVLSCLKPATPKMRPRATYVTQKWKLYALSNKLVWYSCKTHVAEALVPNTSISTKVANPHEHMGK